MSQTIQLLIIENKLMSFSTVTIIITRSLRERKAVALTPSGDWIYVVENAVCDNAAAVLPAWWVTVKSYLSVLWKAKQELSYRKQIARKLRTQCAEGNYDSPVTLKARLTVTQGHWKRNDWVDHTRLTIRRVIGRWILSWP